MILILSLALFAADPDSFRANHLLGESYLKQNNFSAAIPYLEKAWKLDPSDYTNGYDLALVYLETKSVAKSREIINELIRRQDKADLHNLLGDIEEADGHVTEAARQYEIAARMDPTEKNLFDLGSHLLNHRGFEPALKVFDYGVRRYPQSATLRVGLGVADYSLGRYDNAVETLCQAVDLNPRDTKALDFLGKMYDISPKYADEVTKRLSLFARNHPNNAAANYYYALSLRKRDQSGTSVRTAETFLLNAVRLDPNFTDAHYELGVLYEDTQHDRSAIQQFEVTIAQRPDFLKAHYRLANLYKKEGQAELARKEFTYIAASKAKQQ